MFPEVMLLGLFKTKNNAKNEELTVVPNANPMLRESPIKPETTLTSLLGALFIIEVPLDTVKVVSDPAAKAINGTIRKTISKLFIGKISSKQERKKTNALNKIAPRAVDRFASTFSAKNPAKGPMTAMARGGTTINNPVCDCLNDSTS